MTCKVCIKAVWNFWIFDLIFVPIYLDVIKYLSTIVTHLPKILSDLSLFCCYRIVFFF